MNENTQRVQSGPVSSDTVAETQRVWTKEPPEAEAFRAAARALLSIASPADAAVMLADEIELASKGPQCLQ